ncbi:hypothetical protein TELCIR_00890 [Teladorsagia circumcincta]|uniref:Uncharacterized protein n=1 Tax=Teladorsagia circumcincta TaxID=45464 RepID=A0A2G9V3F6_TELCI|nr:hypothetical protein TELCIR_00890 [Teladorsagia circumcincta]
MEGLRSENVERSQLVKGSDSGQAKRDSRRPQISIESKTLNPESPADIGRIGGTIALLKTLHMGEELELISLKGRGRAEAVRLMFIYAEKRFTDSRLTIAQWKLRKKKVTHRRPRAPFTVAPSTADFRNQDHDHFRVSKRRSRPHWSAI